MENARELFKKAVEFYRVRNFATAAPYFRQALALESRSLWWQYLGENYAFMKEWQAMEEAFNEAIIAENRDEKDKVSLAWAYFGRGRAKKVQEKLAEALADFEQAWQIGGDEFMDGAGSIYAPADLFLFKAQTHEALQDYKNAIVCYELFGTYSGKRHVSEREVERLKKLSD
jgi:tetratricopeptide (TPR) repeat protein